jgi:hypothetical protein
MDAIAYNVEKNWPEYYLFNYDPHTRKYTGYIILNAADVDKDGLRDLIVYDVTDRAAFLPKQFDVILVFP